MRLVDLAAEYAAQESMLKARISELSAGKCDDLWRMKTLRAMQREVRDIKVLCRRYYDRGYSRNEKYRL